MSWAIMRESVRRVLPLLAAVTVSSLLLRWLAAQPWVGGGVTDDAIQAVQAMTLLVLMPVLGVALAGARALDADVAWVLLRPVPRWSLAVGRIVTDVGTLAACLAIALAVLGVPHRVAAVEATGSVIDPMSPWFVLLVATVAHGATAACSAVGARPLVAAVCGAAWVFGMVGVPLTTMAAVDAWLAPTSFGWIRLSLVALVPLACVAIAWSMIVAGAQHAPRPAPWPLLVRRSLVVLALCLAAQVVVLV